MQTYKVQTGDSLFKIAQKFYGDGDKFELLAAYNNLKNANALEAGQVLSIPDVAELGGENQAWHNYQDGKIWWRVTAQGIEIKGQGVTKDAKFTKKAGEIWQAHQSALSTAAKKHGVPIPAIIATISTESSGNAKAYRYEPLFYTRYIKNQAQWKNNPYYNAPRRIAASYGLVQIMYTTAYAVGFRGAPEDLYDPAISIDVGAAYIASSFQVKNHHWDPPKIACAYNAGSVRPTTKNDWGIHHHPGHLDRWVPSFNGAVDVIGSSGPAVISPPKPPAPDKSPTALTLRIVFPAQKWSPLVLDLFKHEASGLGEPATFKIDKPTTLPDGGDAYEVTGLVKGVYDLVFSDAATSSVLNDVSDVTVAKTPTILDLRTAGAGTRAAVAPSAKASVQFHIPVVSGQPWQPLILDLFDRSDHVLTYQLEAAPPISQSKYVYTIPDVPQDCYNIDVTDAATLELLDQIVNAEVAQAAVTIAWQGDNRARALEAAPPQPPSYAGKSLAEKLAACWQILRA